MEINVIRTHVGDLEAHHANCNDLRKIAKRDDPWLMNVDTAWDVYLNVCSDFLNIANGPEMAIEDAPGEVRIMPCCKLAEGEPPTYEDYYGSDAVAVREAMRKAGRDVPAPVAPAEPAWMQEARRVGWERINANLGRA